MTLSELCEPLFQYVCLLNRSVRKGASYGLAQVRSDIKGILSEMRTAAAADPRLAAMQRAIEPVLAFFVDFMIRNSGLEFARDWPELAQDYGEDNGDERFFDLLDDALHDPSPSATEQLRVFYTCMGLGFTGWYTGQTDLLRKRMLEIASRIRGVTGSEHASRIVPEAYEHVNTSNLIDPPGASLMGMGIALAGLLAVVFAANLYLYRSSSSNLNNSIQSIIEAAPAPRSAQVAASPAQAPAPTTANPRKE